MPMFTFTGVGSNLYTQSDKNTSVFNNLVNFRVDTTIVTI